MNARLQVEHPVTELVYGLDLVELQLRVAAGEPLAARAGRRSLPRGHAIEARVNAEDAVHGFLPVCGHRARLPPAPPGVRVDDAIEAGSVVGTDYDSMLGKVIVHAPRPADRDRAARPGAVRHGDPRRHHEHRRSCAGCSAHRRRSARAGSTPG